MSQTVPRLRMFAGPNGSGKSTIKKQVAERLWGHYINPDDLEAQIRRNGFFDFGAWNMTPRAEAILPFFTASQWLQNAGLGPQTQALTFQQNRLFFGGGVNSYLASVLADFGRQQLVAQGVTFTFETVMSAPDKVEFVRFARASGFKTYLYFIATENPQINIDRVALRVEGGGHPVPSDKIRQRYYRSLDLLLGAIQASDRAYLWDNSGQAAECFAEFNAGRLLIRAPRQPLWFQTYVLDKIAPLASDSRGN